MCSLHSFRPTFDIIIVIVIIVIITIFVTFLAQKSNALNEMIPENEFGGVGKGDYEDVQEHEERSSIASSFDPIVNAIHKYSVDTTKGMNNEISIPDTVNVGVDSDTFLTSVRVKGLTANIDSQNVTMSWREDSVSAVLKRGPRV